MRMEYLIHTCGALLARHEHGGIAGSVIYGEPSSDGRELHVCTQCAQPLVDADLYRIAHTETETVCTAVDGQQRLAFPFLWKAEGRAYTYASVDADRLPRHEHFDGAVWLHGERIGLEEFARWMHALEGWQTE